MTDKESLSKRDFSNKKEQAAALEAIPGHPLSSFTRENEALSALLSRFYETRNEEYLTAIREVSVHYARKGDLLYPHLKVKYGVAGPSDLMWTDDDEIRDDLASLMAEKDHDADWNTCLDVVLKRIEGMIYKEQSVLFPICAVCFTEEEWIGIYHDSKDYASCFGVAAETWPKAEGRRPERAAAPENEIVMPGGHMTVEQLTALLNTIPMEITFIDADNINRFFNEGPKVFKRPGMAIDREVFSCHPPKIEPMVRAIIDDFRNGVRDSVPVWTEKGGRAMLVKYMAVRDRDGNYVGTVELVQDMEFAKEHFLRPGSKGHHPGAEAAGMKIRTATIEDLDAVSRVEAECFPPAEAATREEFEKRLEAYGNHFWLMFDKDKLVAFVDGFVTDEPDLTDEMYADASMHDESGRWQMIFGVDTIPSYRGKGYAGRLIQRAVEDARAQGRAGLVLTCKEKMIHYYAKFGFVNEGITQKSEHGGVQWYQMRLTF